jgi:ribose transport system substrate-binding protein
MKTIGKVALLAAALLLVAGLALANGQKDRAKGKELSIVLVPKSVGHPFWADLEKGMVEEAKDRGIKATFHGPQEAKADLQIAIVEDYIAMGVSGIAIAANDPATIESVMRRGLNEGIKMISFDTDAPDSSRLVYVGTDNVAAGQQGAKALIEMLKGRGKVAILTGGLTALNLNQRIEGFKEAVTKYPAIEIVSIESHGDALERGIPLVEDLLTEYPDIDAFYCVSGPNVAAEALKAMGYKPGEKIVFGFDIFEPVPTLIREGYIQGTVAQCPYAEGRLVVKTLIGLCEGSLKVPAGKVIGTPTNVVTAENLNAYLKEIH